MDGTKSGNEDCSILRVSVEQRRQLESRRRKRQDNSQHHSSSNGQHHGALLFWSMLTYFFLVLSSLTFSIDAFNPSSIARFPVRSVRRQLQTSQTTIESDGALDRTDTLLNLYRDRLPLWLLQRCHDLGYTYPTRIQKAALDAILDPDKPDVVVQAETGSGKTLCYLLPCLAAVDPARSTVQAMIVVPTRELGLQVARVAKRLVAASETKIFVMSVLQGSQNRRQRAWAWAEPPQVVIGTPEELANMVQLGGIKRYNSIETIVVDEVDACLLNNAGSLQLAASPLHELLSKHLSASFLDKDEDYAGDAMGSLSASSSSSLKKRRLHRRQTILCSATIPQHKHFVKQCVQNRWTTTEPVLVALQTGEQLLPPTLEHVYMVCQQEHKLAALKRLFHKLLAQRASFKVLVFAEEQRPLEEMAQALALEAEQGVYWQEATETTPVQDENIQAVTAVLRYQDNLSQRAAAMQAFIGNDNDNENDSVVRLLFSTDLAARGLDVAGVTHVIHFDLPPDADTYVHRAGRTGRLGRSGQVLSFIAPEQEFVLNRLANKLSLELRCVARQKKVIAKKT